MTAPASHFPGPLGADRWSAGPDMAGRDENAKESGFGGPAAAGQGFRDPALRAALAALMDRHGDAAVVAAAVAVREEREREAMARQHGARAGMQE